MRMRSLPWGLALTGSAYDLNMNEPFRFFALTAFDDSGYRGG